MRNKLTLALLFLICLNFSKIKSESRNNKLNLGIKLGGGISSFTDPLTTNGLTNLNGAVNAGLAFQVPITQNRFSLQSELTYNIRMFTDENPDIGDHNYLINTIEFPIILNTKLFDYSGQKDEMEISLLTGIGISKGLKSRILTDSSKHSGYYGYWEEREYVQINEAFDNIRKNNILMILGLNVNSVSNQKALVGLRYTQFLNSIYDLNEITEDYNFTTKAYCISLELSFYF